MQTCIVPIISYNYAAHHVERCKKTLWASVIFGWVLMAMGTLCFVSIQEQMLRVFSSDELVISIGKVGFRFVGVSFLPQVTSLIFSGVLSGGGQKREKLVADGGAYGAVLCAFGILIFQAGFKLVLAYLPHYGSDHNCGRSAVLSTVSDGTSNQGRLMGRPFCSFRGMPALFDLTSDMLVEYNDTVCHL